MRDAGAAKSVDDGSLLQCNPAQAPGFYCPSSLYALSTSNTGSTGGANKTITLGIVSAITLADTGNKAFYDIAGTFGGNFFDFGLPFFFGPNVFTGIDGQVTSGAGAGPFFTY